jgi:hypothetical protein
MQLSGISISAHSLALGRARIMKALQIRAWKGSVTYIFSSTTSNLPLRNRSKLSVSVGGASNTTHDSVIKRTKLQSNESGNPRRKSIYFTNAMCLETPVMGPVNSFQRQEATHLALRRLEQPGIVHQFGVPDSVTGNKTRTR